MNEPNHILTTIMPTWAHLFRSSTLRRHVKGSRILNHSLLSLVLDGAFSIALLRAGRGQLDNAVWQLAPKDFQNNEMSVFSARHWWKPRFPEKERDLTHITCVYICLHMQIMTSSVRTKTSLKSQNSGASPLWQLERMFTTGTALNQTLEWIRQQILSEEVGYCCSLIMSFVTGKHPRAQALWGEDPCHPQGRINDRPGQPLKLLGRIPGLSTPVSPTGRTCLFRRRGALSPSWIIKFPIRKRFCFLP